MTDPYQTVMVSLVSSVFLLLAVLFYRFIYPKKQLNLFFLMICIAILPIISIFRQGTYESGDLSINAIKTMAFVDAFKNGELLPQWAADLNATYGYPLFVFTYPLPYFSAAFFTLIGFSYIQSIKLILISSFLLSGITMFLWLRPKTGDSMAFIGSVFYLFAPIHLVDMHFRVAIGEMFSFIFIPLCFYSIEKLLMTPIRYWKIFFSLSLSGLILSHQGVSLVTFPLLLLYALFLLLQLKTNMRIKKGLILVYSTIVGLLLSAWYWVPAVFMGEFTQRDIQHKIVAFPQIYEMFLSPWRYGFLFQGPNGEIGTLIGYTHIIAFILGMYLLLINAVDKKYRKKLLFFLASSLVLMFFISPLSRPIWDQITLLRNLQFSYRLLVPLSFFLSTVAAITLKTIKSKHIVCTILFITIASTILNWGNRRVIPEITDEVLKDNLPLSTYQVEGLGPAMPLWADGWMEEVPISHIEILDGEAIIHDVERTTTVHSYIIDAKSAVYLKENTIFFPGWNITANNSNVSIIYTNEKYPGIITFYLPRGLHHVTVKYDLISIQLYSRIASAIGLCILLLLIISSRHSTKDSIL